MAEGWLWQGDGQTPEKAIVAGMARYAKRFGRTPVTVRARRSTLGANAPAMVDGVIVVVDDRMQPQCYLFCERLEP